MTYTFRYFKEYSTHILMYHLDSLVKFAIEKGREKEIAIFKLLSNYSEKEIYTIFQDGLQEQILIPVIEEKPFDTVKQKIDAWKSNSTIIPKNSFQISDIISINTVRKEAVLEFLPTYNCSKEDFFQLVKEIDQFFTAITEMCLQGYLEIQRAEISDKNEMLSGILENIPLIVTRLNKEGKIVFSAGAGLKSLGLGDQDLSGSDIKDGYFDPKDVQKILHGKPGSFIGTSTSTLGENKEFETVFVPQENGSIGYSIDITRQRIAEDRFNELIDGVKDYAIFMLNPDGTIGSWNEGAKNLKRYTKDEIIGKHFSIFYSKEKRDSRFPEYELEQALLHGRFENEGLRVKKDGSTFWANVVITPIYNRLGKHIGFTKITRDLTERKLAEEKIKESESRFRNLINSIKDYAIFMLNPDGTVASWNAGARALKGYEAGEIIGKHFSIFYPKDKIEEKFPQYELEQAKQHGRFEDEGLRLRKDGSTFYANVIITAIYGQDGELKGFSKVTRDLTEKKLNEEKLNQMNQQLEQKVKRRTSELEKTVNELKRINNDLDNFIYTASHDLRAPISNLEGLIYALYDEIEGELSLNPQLKLYKDHIETSIKKFQATIMELTEIAKIQKESSDNEELIDIASLVEDVKIGIMDTIVKNDAQIILDVKDCPSVKFIRKNLKSIFYNLISNGIKYRSPERTPVVSLSCNITDKEFVLTCEDNGLGIKKENIGKMFGMFKRFHDHVEGTGVGLYIVKKIVENFGGDIEVESVEGIGTTFKIYIPLNADFPTLP